MSEGGPDEASPAPAVPAPFTLRGRVVCVTGGSRGLGLAIARVFAAAGAAQLLVARDAARLQAAADRISQEVDGAALATLTGDVADPGLAERAVTLAVARFGRLDILVNNAGIGAAGPIDGVSEATWDAVVAVDLKGPYLLCRAAVPHLKAQRWGRIINVASISGQTGGVRASVAYSAAKAGLIGMTKTLARDLGPYNVTANAIAPGQIETDMGRLSAADRQALVARIPLGRLGAPDDVAYAALYLASEQAGYVTGHTLDVNGGILFR
jgi:NAD(P)-dependent dehydrogenase (short-subunit alcohol dehydrogenase family)